MLNTQFFPTEVVPKQLSYALLARFCIAMKFCYLCSGLVVQRIEREIPNFQMGVRFPPGLLKKICSPD